jgi:hypothetical protein
MDHNNAGGVSSCSGLACTYSNLMSSGARFTSGYRGNRPEIGVRTVEFRAPLEVRVVQDLKLGRSARGGSAGEEVVVPIAISGWHSCFELSSPRAYRTSVRKSSVVQSAIKREKCSKLVHVGCTSASLFSVMHHRQGSDTSTLHIDSASNRQIIKFRQHTVVYASKIVNGVPRYANVPIVRQPSYVSRVT